MTTKPDKIALIDLGIGNVGSLKRALEEVGASVIVASDPVGLPGTAKLVLPGVGGFSTGMQALRAANWESELNNRIVVEKTPCLCICLGMHLLATKGYEGGATQGLDVIQGEVTLLPADMEDVRLPHMGWNTVQTVAGSRLLAGLPAEFDMYFAHSYFFSGVEGKFIKAETTYGVNFPSIIENGNCFATQFHPEKSGKRGLQILANFVNNPTNNLKPTTI